MARNAGSGPQPHLISSAIQDVTDSTGTAGIRRKFTVNVIDSKRP